MKRYNQSFFFLFFVAGLLFAGCGDDFLSRVPPSNYTSENYWEDEIQITTAVNGIYPILRNQFVGDIWKLAEFATDNTTFQFNPADRGGQILEEVDYFLANADNGVFSAIWNSSYNGIARANFILINIGDAAFNVEENRAIREAETRFLRAFFYYNLAVHFGDVPIVLEPLTDEEEAIARRRDPVERVYNEAIIPDLEFAIDNLPTDWNAANIGRATRGAAQMLLAKVYFSCGEYGLALPLLNSIVESGEYGLMQNYRDIFDPAFDNNQEIIFAAQFATAANQGSGFMLGWLPFNSGADITDGLIPGSRAGLNIPTQDIVRAYEDGDRRLNASVGFYEDGGDTTTYIRKYVFPPIPTGGTDVDWPIFRYADALLMQAEAVLETQGGIPDQVFQTLNVLRSRAGLPVIFPGNPNPDLNVQTTEELREALRQERRVELAFESHRWYDLLRYGTLEEVMRAHGEEQKEIQAFLDPFPDAYTDINRLWAIPSNEIIGFGYEQNEGW